MFETLGPFVTYIFAMVGFIVALLFVYKKAMYSPTNVKNREYLKVENALRLSPTKNIFIIKAGSERFLIAGDNANTTLLAKLDKDNLNEEISIQETSIEENRG